MYDRLIYSEREIKAEEIVAALKKAYPNIGIGGLEDGYFCFDTVDNHGYVYLEEYEKDGITPKDYGITWRTSVTRSPISRTRSIFPVLRLTVPPRSSLTTSPRTSFRQFHRCWLQ
jgi:hypothetical protein